MNPIQRVSRLFRQSGELTPGRGMVTGVIAFSLAASSLLGVLAFHFPEYLTTPERWATTCRTDSCASSSSRSPGRGNGGVACAGHRDIVWRAGAARSAHITAE